MKKRDPPGVKKKIQKKIFFFKSPEFWSLKCDHFLVKKNYTPGVKKNFKKKNFQKKSKKKLKKKIKKKNRQN